MKKITLELEYDKYAAFGRTHCEVDFAIYEDDGNPLNSEENRNKAVKVIRKLFDNKNYLSQCVTFTWKDTDFGSRGTSTTRFFRIACTPTMVVWDDHGNKLIMKDLDKLTRKDILALYDDCAARAYGKESKLTA